MLFSRTTRPISTKFGLSLGRRNVGLFRYRACPIQNK